jgi:hypothetical protein
LDKGLSGLRKGTTSFDGLVRILERKTEIKIDGRLVVLNRNIHYHTGSYSAYLLYGWEIQNIVN